MMTMAQDTVAVSWATVAGETMIAEGCRKKSSISTICGGISG